MPARYWHRLLLGRLRWSFCRRLCSTRAADAGWAAARQCGRCQAQAAAGAGAADAGRPAAARQAQSCRPASISRSMPSALPRRARCASASAAPCSSAARGDKVFGHRRPRRQARGQGDRRRACTGRAGSPIHDGTLYIAEPTQISKIDNVEDVLDNPPKPIVIYSDLPKNEPRQRALSSASVPTTSSMFRSPCPATIACRRRAQGQIRRIDLDRRQHRSGRARRAQRARLRLVAAQQDSSTSPTTAATGCRRTRRATSSTASRKPGEDFGAPYCYQGNLTDPQLGWGRSCDEFTPPIALLGPHVAPLGLRFYTGRMFPRELSRRHLRRPSRLLESDQEARRRRGRAPSQQGRHGAVDGAVPHRLSRRQ